MKMAGFVVLSSLCFAVPANAEVLGIGKDKATAILIDAQGVPVGTAKIVESKKKGLVVTVKAKGLPRGDKGIHLHSVGQCESPKFTSAGPHWNPHGKMHGLENPSGWHSGDLPNIRIGKKGRGTLKFVVPGGEVDGSMGLVDGDGGAIVIHANSDDNRTDPSGNSGDRIACGVFRD
jgi:superoxide dismutase, Cu-Zn family